MDLLGMLGPVGDFLNEPIPSFFFELLFLEEFDMSNPLAMAGVMAELAMQAADSGAVAFSEVDGLELSYGTSEYNEAGWSTPRKMFDKVSTSALTVKRYLKPRHISMGGMALDPVTGWCQNTLKAVKNWEEKVITKDILVFIYHPLLKNPIPIGPSALPLAGFLIQEAYPTKWGVSALNSTDDSAPIVETIEFQYTEIQRLEIPI